MMFGLALSGCKADEAPPTVRLIRVDVGLHRPETCIPRVNMRTIVRKTPPDERSALSPRGLSHLGEIAAADEWRGLSSSAAF